MGEYSPEREEATRRRSMSPTFSSCPEARAPHTSAGRTRGAGTERNAVAERSGSAVGAREKASAGAVCDAIARMAMAAATHGVNERMTVCFLERMSASEISFKSTLATRWTSSVSLLEI